MRVPVCLSRIPTAAAILPPTIHRWAGGRSPKMTWPTPAPRKQSPEGRDQRRSLEPTPPPCHPATLRTARPSGVQACFGTPAFSDHGTFKSILRVAWSFTKHVRGNNSLGSYGPRAAVNQASETKWSFPAHHFPLPPFWAKRSNFMVCAGTQETGRCKMAKFLLPFSNYKIQKCYFGGSWALCRCLYTTCNYKKNSILRISVIHRFYWMPKIHKDNTFPIYSKKFTDRHRSCRLLL
jgi:hypothetical protein